MDQQGAALPGVAIVVTNQDNGTFRETVSGADGAFLLSGMTPGTYEIRAELDRLQEVPGPRHQAGRRSLDAGRDPARARGRRRVGHRHRRVAAGRHQLQGHRRQRHGTGVRRPAVVQPQLLQLPRPGARRRVDRVGDDLRRRLDQRRRPERPQRELHDGRVEQQRHLQRRQRRRPGADAGRGGAGVPAADQPVRRRVRHGLGRRRQLGVQAGHQPVPRQRVHVLPGREPDEHATTSPSAAASTSPRPSSSNGAARSAARSSSNRCTSSAASSASCSTAASRPTSRAGRISSGPTSRRRGSGTPTARRSPDQRRPTTGASAGCAKPRRSRSRSTPRTTRVPRYEAETDVDWTLVGNLSSILGSNKVNTFRVSAVSEDVFFGNPLFNDGARTRRRCCRRSTSSASATSRAHAPTAGSTSPTAPTTSSRGSCPTSGAAITT